MHLATASVTPAPTAAFASNGTMRAIRNMALLGALIAMSGCRRHAYVVPETPMPPNTMLLSAMMRELSAQPGFTDDVIRQIDSGGKKGPALLTPRLVDDLRKRILGKDWQGLDRFSGWTMQEINPTVRVVGHEAGKSSELEATSAVHPGSPASAAAAGRYLDFGPYALDKAETVSLAEPSTLPHFSTEGIVTPLGAGVVRGDGPNEFAVEHADSQRLADVLNRLAANKLDGAAAFAVALKQNLLSAKDPTNGGTVALKAPEELVQGLIDSGHTVTVGDARYFANFGHFHYKGADVMMPFWVNSQMVVPDSGGRPLLVPVSHAEYEWHVHGPIVNADVSFYFGIDGKAQWRTMDTLDQAWVMKRNAHEYSGAQAVEVTRLAGLFTLSYMHLHAAHPKLPFGGYYALGVCQDSVSAIEHKMTGAVTLFPNTADNAFFSDPRDAEVNFLMSEVPKDREGRKPEPQRIFGSLPVAPAGNSGRPFGAVTIPGLADDLDATYAAWKDGTLERTHNAWDLTRAWIFMGSAALVGLLGAVYTLRFQKRHPMQRTPRR